MTFINAPVGQVAIIGSHVGSGLELQGLLSRADKFVFALVILKVLGQELAFAQEFWLAKMVGILVESIVFEEVS